MIVIIPAYEPDEQLPQLVAALHHQTDYRIIVVDDGSSDDKKYIFDCLSRDAAVLTHTENRGKGAALKTAMRYVLENMPDADGIVTADADGQHKTEDIISVCNVFKANKDKLVLGVRKFSGKVPLRSKLGNTITKGVFALASGVGLSDTQTGLRAFGTQLIPFLLGVCGERYEYEMNTLLLCAENSIGWVEVSIKTVYLTKKNTSSHFHAVKDSIRIYSVIFKFSGSSFLSFLLDYALFNIFMLIMSGIDVVTAVLLSNVFARIISSVCNYKMNSKFVFKSKGKMRRTASQYFELAIGILLANSLLMELFTAIGAAAFVAKICTELILFLASMLVQRFFIFKPKTN